MSIVNLPCITSRPSCVKNGIDPFTIALMEEIKSPHENWIFATCGKSCYHPAMSPSVNLDATDWKILRELQRDGRITNVELASRVGLSPPPCLRRVQALERAGVISGYRALLDAGQLGFDVRMFAFVGLKSQAEGELKAFEAKALKWPLVREAYAISGEADFLLKCVASDLSALQDFIIGDLSAADNVENVKTTLILRVAKYEPGVPIT